MNRVSFTRVLAVGAVLCAGAPTACSKPSPPSVNLPSGIDRQNIDDAVRARDDFYLHANGKWLASIEIPADAGVWDSFSKLGDETQAQLRTLIEGLGGNPSDGDARKIAALYASFMDEARIEALGLAPVDSEFARIDSIQGQKDVPALIAHFNQINVGAPYELFVQQDARDPAKYAIQIGQAGLGLPDRGYYLSDAAAFTAVRSKYQVHIGNMLKLSGDKDAGKDAADIVLLETELAKIQWSKIDNRDPVKTYNKVQLADLSSLVGHYDWKSYLAVAGIEGKVDALVIRQPSYFTAFGELLQKTPLPLWKSYFKWRVLSAAAPYLSRAYADESFAFYGTALRGIPENKPRWKRGVMLVNDAIGESVGKLYVEKYFPPKNKESMHALIQVVLAAYRTGINTSDWMSPDTKKAAMEKLSKLVVKIGFPETYRDYGKLDFTKGDLFGNVRRAAIFEFQRNLAKLGKPIERDEWTLLPQTVSAYYNPQLNEIEFPAAILQPPLFDAKVDPAANYGRIGVAIGREISHGFDDQGSQYDADGKLRDWFAGLDRDNFKTKIRALVSQYNAYEPASEAKVNGELTLSENIADNAGVAVAYHAYHLALKGKDAPIIDGLTGDQRFYTSFAQAWRAKARQQEAMVRITSDPHSPPEVRVDAALMNQPSFYPAFGIEQGDKMYLPLERRVSFW